MAEPMPNRRCTRAALRAAGIAWSRWCGDLSSANRAAGLGKHPATLFEALLGADGGPLDAAALKERVASHDLRQTVDQCNRSIGPFGLRIIGAGHGAERQYTLEFVSSAARPAGEVTELGDD